MRLASSILPLVLMLVLPATEVARAAPLSLPQTKLVGPDTVANDQLGMSVAVSGDTAVVGAEGDSTKHGAAYVFVRSGEAWSFQQKLTASDGTNGARFGHAVAIDRNTIVVGAYADASMLQLAGSSYVFVRSGGVWTQQQKLFASGGFSGDEFGCAVAVSGDTALIGAFLRDDNGTSSGAAYVFTRSGTTWSQSPKLLPSDGAVNAEFGASVALQGDTALIGAFGDAAHGQSSGAAYVFARSGGTFLQAQKLAPDDGAASDFFGNSVALDRDTAVIGAFGDDDAGNSAGSAYVYVRSSGSFAQAQKLTATDAVPGDLFGYSVAVAGLVVVVGAFQRDDNGADSGAAYLYRRDFGTYASEQKLLASDGAAYAWLGWSVAAGDDAHGVVALAGAYGDGRLGSFAGAAYAFTQPTPVAVPALGGFAGTLALSLALLIAGAVAHVLRGARGRRRQAA